MTGKPNWQVHINPNLHVCILLMARRAMEKYVEISAKADDGSVATEMIRVQRAKVTGDTLTILLDQPLSVVPTPTRIGCMSLVYNGDATYELLLFDDDGCVVDLGVALAVNFPK